MCEVKKAILERRSIKKYTDVMPSEADLDQIMEAGLYAANGMGRQAVKILMITDRKVRDELSCLNARIMGREGIDPFYNAPVVLVVLGDKNCNTRVYDGSLVMGNMMLAAYDLGLGSCWIHRAKEEFEDEYGQALLARLGVEGEWEGIGNLIVGYAEGEPKPAAPRKPNRIIKLK